MRQVENPTCLKKDTLHGDVYAHPAYGVVSAHRINGHAALFSSHLNHSGFVRLEIKQATLTDHGGRYEHVHGTQLVAVVDLSEAQWVALVSRMNMGDGTPCTLRYIPTGLTACPELPEPMSPAERMAERVGKMDVHRKEYIKEHYDKLRVACEGLPAKKRDAIMKEAGYLVQHLHANHEHNVKQLDEAKEGLVNEALVEVDAAVKSVCAQLGIDNLQQLTHAQRMSAAAVAALPSLPHPHNPVEVEDADPA